MVRPHIDGRVIVKKGVRGGRLLWVADCFEGVRDPRLLEDELDKIIAIDPVGSNNEWLFTVLLEVWSGTHRMAPRR